MTTNKRSVPVHSLWDTSRWVALQRAAGKPETTIGLRVYHISRAAKAIAPVGPDTVTVDDLAGWLGAQNWAPETRRSYRASLRSWFTWCQAAGLRGDNPGVALPTVTVPRGMPRPTPEAIYREALARASWRVGLMIELAAVCGLRRGEMAGLERRAVVRDLIGWSLVVTGKGGHVRRIPLPDDLARRLLGLPHGFVFVSERDGQALTAGHIGVLVTRALPVGWSCHTLRHRCATVAYHSTNDLRAVQELMGHAKPETTARYTLVRDDQLRACVAATAQ